MSVSRSSAWNGPAVAVHHEAEGWLMALMPNMALAYPMLIQPLINLKPVSAYAKLDDLVNVANSDSNVMNQVFWLLLFGLSVLLFRKRLGLLKTVFSFRSVLFISLYLGIAALSILWSPVPGIATRRLILQAVVIATIILPIYLCPNRERIVSLFIGLVGAIVLVNMFFVVTQPPGRLGYLGIYSNKNILGVVAAICCLFLAYGVIVGRGIMRIGLAGLLLGAFLLTVMSQSKTSLGFLVLVPILSVALLTGQRLLKMHMAALVLYSLVVGATLSGLYAQVAGIGFQDVSMALFGDATFTGRSRIWDFVLDVYQRSPIVGTGYASFWGTGTSSVAFREAPGFIVGLLQAHNGYLDVLLETGLVGMGILVCLLLSCCNQVNRVTQFSFWSRWLVLSVMLFVTLHNLLESSWFRSFGSQWVVFLFVVGLSLPPLPTRRERQTAQVPLAPEAAPSRSMHGHRWLAS